MLQTRKVNTYGRRSTAIVSTSRIYTPSREAQWLDIPTSDSEASSSVHLPSPPRARARRSTLAAKKSEAKPPSNLPAKRKKENLVADPDVPASCSAKPKRKPLVASSPKVRGSPKQRQMDKRMKPLAPVSNLTKSPLRALTRSPHRLKHPQKHTASTSQHSIGPIPGGYPPMNSARRTSASSAYTRDQPSAVLLSGDSDAAKPRRTTLPPLARQNAILGSPPIRFGSRSRPSAGSGSDSSFYTPASPRRVFSPVRPLAPDDAMPSPVDSDDEIAFLDVVAELEALPALTLPVGPSRTTSEPVPLKSTKTASLPMPKEPPSKVLIKPELRTAKHPSLQSSEQRPPLPSTKSLPLGPTKSRPSIMSVEVPVARKKAEPAVQAISITLNRQDNSGSGFQEPTASSSTKPQTHSTRKSISTKPARVNPGPSPPLHIPAHSRPSTKSQSTAPRSKPERAIYSPTVRSLLSSCSQSEPVELEAFVATFSTDDVHELYPSSSRRRWRKIGEASYSEVFGLGGVVVKVVPLRVDGDENNDGPCVSEAEDVEKEIAATRAMGEIQSGFIKLIRAHVARGAYPQELLELWDAYKEEFGSDGFRPDSFSHSQLYVLLILPDGGPDLEHYTFIPRTSWRIASTIFWQVAQTLAQAESLVQFEHRDLHWGQILVQNVHKSRSRPDPPVRVTLIDLGLSRMNTHTRLPWYTELEPEIFEGQGEYQFDVYRMMKAYCLSRRGSGWEDYRPLTNVMWLHYLARQLLTSKGLRKPDTVTSRYHTADDVQAESRACAGLVEIEKLLGAAVVKLGGAEVWKAGGGVLAKVLKRGHGADVSSLGDATGVVQWGAERGWVKDTTW